jgi:hypothetical protein
LVSNDDWRLQGQEDYLKGKTLYFRKFIGTEKWDHEHCVFCSEKIMDSPEAEKEGYTTQDKYYWICKECFKDFKDMFKWKISE